MAKILNEQVTHCALSSVFVLSSYCAAEWVSTLLRACVPTLCQPGPEDPCTSHGECVGPSDVYTHNLSLVLYYHFICK